MDVEIIKTHVVAEAIQWTNHAAIRLFQRNISRDEIVYSLQNGEILEQYPNDYPHPSCLVLGRTEADKPLHIVCASDGAALWIITAYWPNTYEWDSDFRERKR